MIILAPADSTNPPPLYAEQIDLNSTTAVTPISEIPEIIEQTLRKRKPQDSWGMAANFRRIDPWTTYQWANNNATSLAAGGIENGD